MYLQQSEMPRGPRITANGMLSWLLIFVFLLIAKSHFTILSHKGLSYRFCDLNRTLKIEILFYFLSSVSGKYTKYSFICIFDIYAFPEIHSVPR